MNIPILNDVWVFLISFATVLINMFIILCFVFAIWYTFFVFKNFSPRSLQEISLLDLARVLPRLAHRNMRKLLEDNEKQLYKRNAHF